MDPDDRQDRTAIAWASVLLLAVAFAGLGLAMAQFRTPATVWIARILVAGGLLAIFNALLMLTIPKGGPLVPLLGRVLAWCSFLWVAAAGVVAIFAF